MSSSGASFPITFTLVAEDNASSTFDTLNSVLKEGQAAGADTISQYQDIRSETRLQTGALSTLVNQFRLGNENAMLLAHGLSAVGSVGQTVLSIVTAMSTSELALQQAQTAVTATTQKIADDQNYYNQMVAQYGSNSVQALDALGKLHSDQSALIQQSAELQRAGLQTDVMYAGIGMSVGTMAAAVINAMPYMEALGVKLGLTGAEAAGSGVLMDGFSVSEDGMIVSTMGASGAMGILNAVMDANPIILLALAIAAIVAIVYLATDGFTRWGAITGIVQAAFKDFKTVLLDVGSAALGFATWLGSGMVSAWNTLSGGAKVAGADVKDALTKTWAAVQSDVGVAWGAIAGALGTAYAGVKDGLMTFIQDYIAAWRGVWNQASTIAYDIWSGIETVIKDAINGVIDIVNAFINGLDVFIIGYDAIAGTLHAPTISVIPDIPHLAQGGIVTQPTIAMIGEAGAEAVMPLSSAGLSGGAGGATVININVAGTVLSEHELLDVVNRGLYTHGYAQRTRGG